MTSLSPSALGVMSTKLKFFPQPDGHSYESLIHHPKRRDERDGRDGDPEAAVSNENQFSLLIYFCFFVIGLSMMWTWYIDFHSIYMYIMKVRLTLETGP
jgi:hypothetical protein